MNYKKYVLAVIHIVLSLCLGYALGAIKLYEALYKPTLSYLLFIFISLALWYCLLFINFLFSFANQKKIVLIYTLSSMCFGAIYFIQSSGLLLSLLTVVLYFTFLMVTQYLAMRREKIFVRFSVHTIFFPIVKQGMFFLLILFAIMGYAQTKFGYKNSTSNTEALLKIFAAPVTYALNKQVNIQVASQDSQKLGSIVGNDNKDVLTKVMLEQTVAFLDPSWTKKYIGIEPQNIPIDKAIIYKDGSVNLGPVITDILPEAARYIDQKLSRYLVYIPVVLTMLLVLILQPFFYLASFLFSLTAPLAMYVLFKTGFLVKEVATVEKEIVRL